MNFYNPQAKVVRHKTGYSSAETIMESAGLCAKEAMAAISVNERAKAEQQHYAQIEKNHKYAKQTSAIIEASLAGDRLLKSSNDSYAEGKELLFKNILFEAFYSCLYLDDDFKGTMKESLYGVVSDYVDQRGGFKLLENAVMQSKSPFLAEMKRICEATARNVCNRKLSEEDQTIDFSLNAEEEDEFNYSKSNLGIEELSDLVKSKVLTVVKDEKQREKQEAELLQDLADEVEASVEEVEEAMQKSMIDIPVVEEGTLFNSIFRDSYAQYIKEGCQKATESDEWDEDTEDFEIDMDVILAETITKYTLMEMSYSMQLENFSHAEVRKMVHLMLNK